MSSLSKLRVKVKMETQNSAQEMKISATKEGKKNLKSIGLQA